MALTDMVLEPLTRKDGPLAPLAALARSGLAVRTILAAISALELRPGQRVVELGFGGGLSLPLLLRAVGAEGQVFAIEGSRRLIDRNRRPFIVPRMQGRLRLEHAQVESLPLGDASWDAALSLDTMPDWADVDRGLRELARVLAPGGRLVLGLVEDQGRRLGSAGAKGRVIGRVVVPERLEGVLPRYGFENIEARRTPDAVTLMIARRAADEWDDEL